MVIAGKAESPAGDAHKSGGSLVIMLKEEGGCGDPCRGGGLFRGSSWSRRVVPGIPAEEENYSGDPHGDGELFWRSLQRRIVLGFLMEQEGGCGAVTGALGSCSVLLSVRVTC